MTGQQLVTLINYFAHTAELSDAEVFIRKLAQRVPSHKDQLMTLAEQLEKKGIEKGLRAGALKIAETMLKNGMDPVTVIKMTGLTEDDLAKIEH